MRKALLSLTLLSAIAGCCCTLLSWEELSVSGLARARWFAGTAVAGGKLYLFGGQGNPVGANDTGILANTWSLDLSTSLLSWEQVSMDSSPTPRYGFVGGVYNNFWIISHGCDLDTCYSDTWAMDLSAATPVWFQLIDSSNTSLPFPEARFTVAGGIYPGADQLWISMGESNSGRKLSDTWILQLNSSGRSLSGTWQEVSPGGGLNQYHPFLASARSLHAGSPVNASTFAIFGGCASGGQVGGACPLQDAWLLGVEDGEWQSFSTCATPVVRSNMVPIPGRPGEAFILQGSQNYSPGIFPQLVTPGNETSGNDIFILYADSSSNNMTTDWKQVQILGTAPDGREGASVAVDMEGGVVYLVGGRVLDDSSFRLDVWRLSGNGEENFDEGCPAIQFTYVQLHGVLMYIAWGLLLPLGSLLGRYYRWTWPCWFILHIICQSLGVLLTVSGFVVIFLVGSFSSPDFPHAIVGIILTFLLIQQFLSGVFHPCVNKENGKTPFKDKSPYRKCWEVYHGASGFLSTAIGLSQVTLGVLLIGAPLLVLYVWAGLGGLWVLGFLVHEIVYICYKLVHRVRRKRVY